MAPVVRSSVLVLCCLAAVAQAYPALFVSRIAETCTSHPVQAHMGGRGGGHLAPIKDASVKFQLSVAGKPVAKLCPGATHTVRVQFAAPRHALLTSTVGTFAEGDPWDCPNRVLLDTRQAVVHTATLKVPCRSPASAKLQVTSTDGIDLPFQGAAATITVDPACAEARCASQVLKLPVRAPNAATNAPNVATNALNIAHAPNAATA